MFAYLHTYTRMLEHPIKIQNSIHFYISNILSHLLRSDKETKALITARHGESIRFNLARWT